MQGAGHRVAITGYGVVAPCGIGKEAFWTGLLGPGFSGSKSIEIENWDPLPYFDNPKDARRSDRCEQFALAAAGEAIAQSGELPYDRSRIGTIFGTGIGGLRTLEENVIIRVEKGERRVSPFLVPMMMSNASGAAISMRYGFQGPAETICTACAAATHAIGNAARLVAWLYRAPWSANRLTRLAMVSSWVKVLRCLCLSAWILQLPVAPPSSPR